VPRRRRDPRFVLISSVAERYEIHPQTLRMYEREGLLTPTRSEGNTRLYDDDALRRLETILTLTRDLGVNLAGVEVILHLREQMAQMQVELDRLIDTARRDAADRKAGVERSHALVPLRSRLPVRIG
jgi:MerR family transcriptional regulator/heat shock protein HspR